MTHSRTMRFGRYDYATFITFCAYAAGSVVVPVTLVELAHDLGFSLEHGGMSAGGALLLGRTAAIILTMLLCGFAAGRWGKRRTLGWAVVLMAAGIGLCACAPVYGILFLALTITGLGEGVVEGLATPFVQDIHPGEPGRYLNFAHAFWPIGVMTTVIIAGVLLSRGVSWRLIICAVSAVALIPAVLLLVPARKGHEYPEHPEPLHWSVVWNHAAVIVRVPHFWLFFAAMFVAGGGEFCLTFWSASHIQLHFAAAPWAGGVGTAFFALGMVLGRIGWGYLIKQHQLNALIFFSALAGTIITAALPAATTMLFFFGLLFLAGLATAPYWPSVQSYCADRMPGTDTTMLFILLSCAGVPGCGFFTWLMGYVGNQSEGLATAFYLVPACYLVLALLIGYDCYCVSKSKNKVKE